MMEEIKINALLFLVGFLVPIVIYILQGGG